RLREIGVYAEVIDGRADAPPAGFTVHGIILSGGPDSAYEEGSRRLPAWVMAANKPILGICYGMCLLIEHFGGKMRGQTLREYGRATLNLKPELGAPAAKIFYGLPVAQSVWMSHGDDVEAMPRQLILAGESDSGAVAAIVHKDLPIAGLQFHPEVTHSER